VGFFAKFLIVLGAVEAGYLWIAIAAVVLSGLTLAYLLKIENNVFMKQGKTNAKQAPYTMRLAMVLLVVLALALGIGFLPIVEWVISPAAHALLRGLEYSQLVFSSMTFSF
jgi:NADH:ubiquinone oxidoreductase subunit 2 (subunit N)